MTSLAERLPVAVLDRVRLAALVFAMLNAAMVIPVLQPHLPAWQRLISVSSLLLLTAGFLATYVRVRVYTLEPVASGVLLFGFGISLSATSIIIGLALSVVVTQSLYGTQRSVTVRTLAVMAGTTILLLLPPGVLNTPPSKGSVPLATVLMVPTMFAILMRSLATALGRQEEASAREALVATTGKSLLGLSDVTQARAVVAGGLRDLCRLTPGLVLLGVRRDEDMGVLTATYGVAEPPAISTTFDATCLVGLDDTDGDVFHRLDTDGRDSAAIDTLAGSRRSGWMAFGLGGFAADQFLLAASSNRRLPGGLLDILRTLLVQLSLAEANCRSHFELNQLANRDQLTTMPNRRAFFQILVNAVDAAAGDESGCALFVIDLDDFKQVNDTFGHAAGDQLLVEIAERMMEVVGDRGVACRFGGDEFAVLFTDLDDPAEADLLAVQMCERLRLPVLLSTGTVTVGASIGVVNGTPGATAGDLMRCADIAMYSAKAQGKNRVERFVLDRHGPVAHLRQLEDHIASAVAREEIDIHYQPVVELRTGRCVAVQAQPYWNHPIFGLLAPEAFIPLAERHSHVRDLIAHILVTTCHQLVSWDVEGTVPQLPVCVAIPSTQLSSPGFDHLVAAVLAQTGLAAHRLILAFTESEALIDRLPRAQLTALTAEGAGIAIGDFGTGNTSLAHLRALPLRQLRLDLNPINDDTGATAYDDVVVGLIMSVSQFLHLETVATGVETFEQAEGARRLGIDQAQGSYIGAPMPAAQFVAWLARTRDQLPALGV